MKRLVALLALVFASGCEIAPSIEIKAPVEEVWSYMADSSHAHDWSVYFDHITPMGGPPGNGLGALRRCYRRADEQGISWDERVTELQPQRLRVMRTFNVKGFKKQIFNEAEYDVFQRFEPLPNGHTRLTLATEIVKPRTLRGWWNALLNVREATRVVDYNLENIAAAIEAKQEGRPYARVHPYEHTQRWD